MSVTQQILHNRYHFKEVGANRDWVEVEKGVAIA